jgi:hypothetical protein
MIKAYQILVVLLFSLNSSFAQTLWAEDFTNETNGATSQNGASVSGSLGGTWSVAATPSGGAASFSKQTPVTGIERFRVNQSGTEGVWQSNVITISGISEIGINLDLVTYYASSTDYVRAYYKLNGGPEVLFGELYGSNTLNYAANASVTLTGTSVQLVIRARENTAGNDPIGFGLPRNMGWDNIEIVQITTLYSRASANWDTNGTWSSVSLGGASCGCIPDNTTRVIVGNTHIVSMDSESEAISVTVQNSATLRWTAATDLNITRGGYISVTGTGSINRNGNVAAQIDFDIAATTNYVSVNSTNANAFAPGDLEVNGAATLAFNGAGNISLGDDFLVNAGASITNSLTGTFTVGDDLTFSTGDATLTNSGTLTVTSDIIVSLASNDNNVITNNFGASLTFTNLDANTADIDILNSGTLTQRGNFTDIDEVDTNFDNLATGEWNWSLAPNTTYDVSVNTIMDLTAAGNTFNYSGAGAQTILPLAHHHIKLSNSGIKTSSSDLTVNGDLEISGTAALNLDTGNDNITIYGDWTNSSTNGDPFDEDVQTVSFVGNTTQTITNIGDAQGTEFYNLVINNTSLVSPQIVVSGNVNVGGALTLTNGIIQTTSSNLLIMLNGATTSMGTTSSFVDGPIQYNMAVPGSTRTLNFPIGKNDVYGAVSLRVRHSVATSYSYTAEVIASSALALGYTLAPGTDRVSALRYWDIKRGLTTSPTVSTSANLVTTGLTTAPQITINYVAEDDVNQPATLTIVKNVNDGTEWNNIGATASGFPSGSITSTAPSSNFTSFSFFALANLNGGTNPLPIELLSFKAGLINNTVELKWTTASETNNDFFIVERTTDVERFESIIQIEGKGTTKEVNHYTAWDPVPLSGRSYYRLKQTDFDGKFSYSPVQVVDYEGPQFATLTAFPNPLSGQNLTVKIEGLGEAKEVPIQIWNVQGKKIYDVILEVKTGGTILEEIPSQSFPTSGMYIIKAGQTLYLTKKIVIE